MKKLFVVLAAIFLFVLMACSSGGGSNPVPAPSSSAKAITAFSLNGVIGTINETAKTIAVAMPYGTDVTALVATFTTTGSGVKVGSTVQVSSTTPNNFTSPVTYTVTAADSTTQDYTVTVTVASSSAKAITAFSLNGVVGTINETAKTIAVAMPYGTDVTALVATFTTTGSSVKVGSTVQVSGTTPNNFTSLVTYTVTAADSTTQDYNVTVTVASSSAKAITAFSLNGVVGTINETAKTIAVIMPYGTSVTNLVATFTTTGSSVKVGSTVQVSGTTPNNFTSPVTYTVTAADSTTQDYTVTVTVALSSAKTITAFSLNGVPGIINETGKTIAVTMPYGTDATALVTIFTTTGSSVKVGLTVQVSGTTPNNFTSPVTYTVTAADSTTQDYTVTVTVAVPPSSGTWTQKADFGGKARNSAIGFSIGSKGYIGTGYYGSSYPVTEQYGQDFWEYDSTADTWTQKADVGGGNRWNAVGFSIDSKGYIGTGLIKTSPYFTNDFWEYDPTANTWTQKADFGGTARYYAVGFSIGSKGYIGTGYANNYQNDFWEYDPTANTWTKKADFGGGMRASAVGFSIGSKGYIGTGLSPGSGYILNKDFWEYEP